MQLSLTIDVPNHIAILPDPERRTRQPNIVVRRGHSYPSPKDTSESEARTTRLDSPPPSSTHAPPTRPMRGRVIQSNRPLPQFIPPPPPLEDAPPLAIHMKTAPPDTTQETTTNGGVNTRPTKRSDDDEYMNILFTSLEEDDEKDDDEKASQCYVSYAPDGGSPLNLTKTISSNSAYSYTSDLDVEAIIGAGFDTTEGRGVVVVTALGTTSRLPRDDGTPGLLQSEQGTFEFSPGDVRSSAPLTLGIICTFSSSDRVHAFNIMPSMNVPPALLESIYVDGKTSWDSTVYVLESQLRVKGTLLHNDYIERIDDVFDPRLQDDIATTLNAFINTEGGCLYIGIAVVDRKKIVVSGVVLTNEEQQNIMQMVENITHLWNREIPNREEVIHVDFIPLCSRHGMIAKQLFVVRISVRGPLFREDRSKITFSFRKDNQAFVRKLGFNVVLSSWNRATAFE